MTDYIAQPGPQTLTGTSGNDNFIFNFDQVDSTGVASPEHDIDAGDVVDGGAGTDALWAGQTMDLGYSENFDFRPVTFISIEELDFNWMAMQMPGKLTFNSSQFGSGLSNNLVVKGAWGDNDITVYLDTANFDASGWTFPTPSTTTVDGSPAGTSFYGWGPYVYTGNGAFKNLQVGVFLGDTIHLVGSAADNVITGTIVADIITGGEGADTLTGGAGNDSIDGGGGNDTVVFSGNRADYTVTEASGTFTVVDNRAGSPDGTDTVTTVESFQFADMTLAAANVVAGTPPDTTPPAAPTIDAWTDTTAPVLMNGANPLWRISGTTEPGATVRLYSVTLNPDGTIATSTQISTYTQATATTIVAGPDTVVADANGHWEFQTNLNEHQDRRIVATATDAAGNASANSLVYIHGGHHATTFSFADPSALSHVSAIEAYHDWTSPATGDTLQFTTATTVVDSDFAKITDMQNLKLTGASTVTLGATALAAGVGGSYEAIEGDPASTGYGKVIVGNGDTSLTDTNAGSTLRVETAALAGHKLTLAGSANFIVSDFVVNNSTGAATSDPAGSDTIDASATTGTNSFNGGGGNDVVKGGAGADTAVFSGNRADYTINFDGTRYTVADMRAGSPDGTDTLTGVETLQFADQSVAVSPALDTSAPSTPTIASWTDSTAPILMNGADPLWRISGTAEPGAIIKLFSTTVGADGTVTARTQLATYTQATATTVAAGPDFVVADASGHWEFQTNLSEHGNRRVSATATDAAGNVSAYSLVDQQGGHHSTTVAFTSPAAFAAFSRIDGYHQDTAVGDVLSFTDADVTVTDADFAKVTDYEGLQFAGTATVTLGANALAAGVGGETIPGSLGKVKTGTGNTTITDSNHHTLTVDGAALAAGTTLSLSGAADYVATGSDAGVKINAANTTGTNALTGGVGNDTLWGGSGANTIHGGDGADAIWLAFGAAGGAVASAMLYGDGGDDNFYVNRQSYISSNVTFDGGEGHDVLWAGRGMSNYEEDFDFSSAHFVSIEGLSFNYMPMEMPGQAIFSSAQFGSGQISNTLEVRGAWGDNDITVNLVSGDSSFDASGWTFPSGAGVSMPTAYAWGSFVSPVTNTFVTAGQQVGGMDTIHLNGSAGANAFTGTSVDDIITGAGGNDVINGGAGRDTAVYSGNRSDYTVTRSGTSYTVTDNRAGSPDGTDTLTNIERLQFADAARSLQSIRNDFDGDGRSAFLIQNGAGVVVSGEIAGGGQLAYAEIAYLGSEWTFRGTGDFLGDGEADFLLEDANGVLVLGDVNNGQTSFTQIGGLGPEWHFRGTGDFNGSGHDQFLLENDAGVVVVGNVQGGQAQYAEIAGLGPEWTVVGVGDYLGDGTDDFLLENTAGVVVVGDVDNGSTTFTEVGALGSEWKFVGTGDYLGLGHDQFIIENQNGVVVRGDAQTGHAQYTEIGGLGPEWSFVGTGDYAGTGTDSLMLQNQAGVLVNAAVGASQLTYAEVGAIGSEWSFRA